MEPILGIDFGTSGIRCSIWTKETGTRLISLNPPDTLLPNHAVVGGGLMITGSEARLISALATESAIYDVKAFLGQTLTGAQAVAKYFLLPFHFQSSPEEEPEDKSDDSDLTLSFVVKDIETADICILPIQDVVLKLLQKVKYLAEDEIGEGINLTQCCIAVSTDLSIPQLVEPLYRAGFENLKFVMDQEAAIVGCLKQAPLIAQADKYVLLDIGASASRVSIYDMDSVTGMHSQWLTREVPIGVRWLDFCLIELCMKEFRRQHNIAIINNLQAVHRLRLSCEEARMNLSREKFYLFEEKSLYLGQDFFYRLTREKYEKIIGLEIHRLLQSIMGILTEIKLDPANCRFLLLGGGSRIPLVKTMLQSVADWKFDERFKLWAVDAVAWGTAELGLEYFSRQMTVHVPQKGRGVKRALTIVLDGENSDHDQALREAILRVTKLDPDFEVVNMETFQEKTEHFSYECSTIS